jgi:elongation factor G
MKEYATESLRNIALVSHSGTGKTMLAEAFLHFSGATTRLGKIEDGSTSGDFDDEEIRRGISLYTKLLTLEYKDHKINLLDTPGYNDFVGEMISALRVADSALVLIDSVSGFEVGTEIAWHNCDTFKLPRMVIINKMDRENANFQKALSSVEAFSKARLIPIQLPWGEKQAFKGIIDLLTLKAYPNNGKTAVEIPAEFKDDVETAHLAMMEAAAEGDDALLEKYLESSALSESEIKTGLRSAFLKGYCVPVLVSAASSEIGIGPMLDAIISLMPSPKDAAKVIASNKGADEELAASDSGPLAAYVWKTTADPFVGKQTYFRIYSGTIKADSRVWNQTKGIEERFGTIYTTRGKDTISVSTFHCGDLGMVAKLSETSTSNTLCDKTHPLILSIPKYPNALYKVAISPKTQADSTKISPVLTRLCEEDMTLNWYQEPATNQTILQGMGDQHIDVAIRRAEAKFQVSLIVAEPKIPYQEAITRKGDKMYRHKKQTGGSGQFGEVWLRVEPYADGDLLFENVVFGGSISNNYMPAIEKGIRAVMKEGILAGYTVAGIHVEVYDGKEHPVDSKPVAFEIAGREAFKLAFMDAGPVLREPIMNVKITVPEANMGDVLGDLNTRRARVQGMETEFGRSTITCQVPLAEMQRYTTTLRSMTQGRGIFEMELAHYENVPAHLTQQVIAAHQKENSHES